MPEWKSISAARWYTVYPRHNARRIGRILIARGRDAADIPMITSFGPHRLTKFKVITEEIPQEMALAALAPQAKAACHAFALGGV
jgi:hypothetical protein